MQELLNSEPELVQFISAYILIIAVVYFLPTFFALIRLHRKSFGIFIFNLLAGWTVLGWLAILGYALLSENRKP